MHSIVSLESNRTLAPKVQTEPQMGAFGSIVLLHVKVID